MAVTYKGNVVREEMQLSRRQILGFWGQLFTHKDLRYIHVERDSVTIVEGSVVARTKVLRGDEINGNEFCQKYGIVYANARD